MAMLLTLVAELRSSTTTVAVILLKGVSMIFINLFISNGDNHSHFGGSFRWGGLPRGGSVAEKG
ncbi:hypothetical protein N444_19335 [Escherichia coli O6:H16:CFA/II str. B2C]|uniref:Uncharacterized protein n=2 Tax=Escherichia coli TaxID=562 RepID=A0AAP7NWC0_ECOLX|nr:hypothetical protein BLJ80_19805 [Escherichia coli]EFR15491.1 hypothetical protein EC236275_3212 [Escherichia coli 2362-75]ETS25592.1 hypothetical protein N444_19335 [Escherichia coli O6:H16:CFA/II str. B2C]EYV90029.1 hypothetical protein BY42_16010 [Escherichia coli O6:H16 str. 99-3165]EZA77773.1 hypothetical protein BY44_12240 [Escherichia coli O6:H16 str. F5656C1]EZB27971.1 hypothetical protein BY55_22230 [Escherichia coli O169:H41 str. F9792]